MLVVVLDPIKNSVWSVYKVMFTQGKLGSALASVISLLDYSLCSQII
jgi:hypothetical protein